MHVAALARDVLGELVAATNGAGQTTAYAYDTEGNVTSVTYPLPSSATWAQSHTVTSAYDPAGNLTQVSDFNDHPVLVTNDTAGNAVDLVLGTPTFANSASNDAVVTSEDQTGAPQRIALTNYGTPLSSFTYADAPAGNVTSETDAPSTASSPTSYTYDAKGQVTSATPGTSGASSFAFDQSGNLTTLPNGASGTYNAAQELTSSDLSTTTTSYTYDANGNRTGSSTGGTATSTATWNGAGQLTSYSNAASDMSGATYAGNGLRERATTGTGTSASTQDFTWDTTGSIPRLLMDGTNAYLYAGANAPIEQVSLSTGTLSYLVTDALGSVRDVVASTGAITASTCYGAWGTPSTSGGVTSSTPFGFAGGYSDPTGLVYLINRYYDPQTGQFLSVDPLVDLTGESYAYVDGDPISGVDSLGLSLGINPCSWGNVCHHLHNVADGLRHNTAAGWNDTGGKAVHVVKTVAVEAGQYVYHHASGLSTVASGLAAVSYAGCAVTEGIGCGVGLFLSTASTALSGASSYRACVGGAGGCTSAVLSLAASVVTTGGAAAFQGLAKSGLEGIANGYAREIYLIRQVGVINGAANGLITAYSGLVPTYSSRSGGVASSSSFASSTSRCE